MASSRWRDGPAGDTGGGGGGGVGTKTARRTRRQPRPPAPLPPEEPALGCSDPAGEDAAAAESSSSRELPRWMRLYFYGMHGVTLDVFLSALRSFHSERDPKLVGFSSPYLWVVHALIHFALEKVYARKHCFQHRPAVFHLVFYPSVFIGLQILAGNIGTSLADRVRVVSATQLAVHYVLALYFSQVFHRGLSRLQYNPHPHDLLHQVKLTPAGSVSIGGGCLPGPLRFLFFGMHGFLDEVIFTSAFDLVERRDGRMSGHTSLWSFLVYGTCSAAVERVYLRLHFARGWGTLRRLPVYTGLIYLWELGWGLALRQIGACSWDYSHYPLNFMGLITLLYLPGWVCLSLYQDGLFNILLRVRCGNEGGDEGGGGSAADDGPRRHHEGVNGKETSQLTGIS